MKRLKQEVTDEITRIVKREGSITAERTIKAAEPVESPLHDNFDWDNDTAGHKYRLVQARTLLRQVKVVIDGAPQSLVHVPSVTVSQDTGRQGYYKPIKSVAIDTGGEFDLAMGSALRTLSAAKRAVHDLKSAAGKHQPKRLAAFTLAAECISTAHDAILSLHDDGWQQPGVH